MIEYAVRVTASRNVADPNKYDILLIGGVRTEERSLQTGFGHIL